MKFLVYILLIISGVSFSQTRSLKIGDVTLSLGMKASDAVKGFPKDISVSSKASFSETTYIIQQQEHNSSGYKIIGQFKAVDGKITSITRFMGQYSTENYSQGLADLYSLLSRSGGVKYSAYPENKSDAAPASKSIVFNIKNMSIYMHVNDYGFSLAESIK